jgi:hypothetical protein
MEHHAEEVACLVRPPTLPVSSFTWSAASMPSALGQLGHSAVQWRDEAMPGDLGHRRVDSLDEGDEFLIRPPAPRAAA